MQGTSYVGGLIGYSYMYHTSSTSNATYSLYVKKCYASGDVTGTSTNVGGLIGSQQSSINVNRSTQNAYNYIQECYATRKSNKYRK